MTFLTKYKPDNIQNDIKATIAMTDKYHSEMIAINEHIADMLAKLHDKCDKKIEK